MTWSRCWQSTLLHIKRLGRETLSILERGITANGVEKPIFLNDCLKRNAGYPIMIEDILNTGIMDYNNDIVYQIYLLHNWYPWVQHIT